MITPQQALKGSKSPRRPYRFSTRDIATASNRSLAAVRKDRQRGHLDPHSLASLSSYVAKHRDSHRTTTAQ